MSRQSCIHAPDGGCLAIVIVGYRAAAGRRVPSNQSGHAPGWLPVVTIRYWSGGREPGDLQIPKMEPSMARVLYTAEATVTGGRAGGHGRTNDGALDVHLRSPKEMGSQGGGTNPEQLFAVNYAALL